MACSRERDHLLNFFGSRYAAEILAHDFGANGGVAEERGDIEGGGIFAAGVEPCGDGPGRVAVGTENYGGDALGDLGFGERVGVQAFGE